MKEYITWRPGQGDLPALRLEHALAGTEVYCADLADREGPLFTGTEERDALAHRLGSQGVRRLHASYWASPTAFLRGADQVRELFGSDGETARYYGDVTGEHLFFRWRQEYELARAMGAQAYTFHLIDYFPIDGLWRFSLSRQEVITGMAAMTARLLSTLEEAGLLDEHGPRVELENAGWGLEYGAQTAEDFAWLLERVPDPQGKLTVAWDTNHLLHALGRRGERGAFLLPGDEITPDMAALEAAFGHDPAKLALEWVGQNLLHPALKGRVACVHLSDCALKREQFFTRGYLEYPWRAELEGQESWEGKEHYGEQLVLTHYDSHLPLGRGILSGPDVTHMLQRLEQDTPDFALLHELKNSAHLAADLRVQRQALRGKEV